MSDVSNRLLRTHEVVERVGLSDSTLRRLERSGQFPRRRKLSSRAVAWLSNEVEGWIEARS